MNRFIRPLLMGIAGLALVILLISLLLPEQVMVSRWIRIGAGSQKIISYLVQLDQWKEWNQLVRSAQDLQFEKGGGDSLKGSLLQWGSGSGKMNRITLLGWNNLGLVTEMELQGERRMTSGFSVETRMSDSTQVVWYIIQDLKWYPWEKFYGIMADKLKGPAMQQSLEQLKSRMEAGD